MRHWKTLSIILLISIFIVTINTLAWWFIAQRTLITKDDLFEIQFQFQTRIYKVWDELSLRMKVLEERVHKLEHD